MGWKGEKSFFPGIYHKGIGSPFIWRRKTDLLPLGMRTVGWMEEVS
jgi:hypothetical protein